MSGPATAAKVDRKRPFRRDHRTAAAPEIPADLFEKLAPDGRWSSRSACLTKASTSYLVTRGQDGAMHERHLPEVAFMPLTENFKESA